MATVEADVGNRSKGAVSQRIWRPTLGAWPENAGARFRVWAPDARDLEVVVARPDSESMQTALSKNDDGTFSGFLAGVLPGNRYSFLVDDHGPFPDPASRFQPEGVHGPSELIDPNRFDWSDAHWRGLEPERVVLYELHVGTFTPEGTFAGVINRLPWLCDLGVTAIELMPVADFAGSRSWGYDGVALYAPSHQYGHPDDLRRLVDTAHSLGMAVLLDVVYNHFGPVGNYTLSFSPDYLSRTHSSAWAACVNLDGERSERVREFFIENAHQWVHEYHLDGLRLDATHALIDTSSKHLVVEIAEKVQSTVAGRRVLIVAEDDRNVAAMLRPASKGGWELDGVWADDLHHQLRRHLTGDDEAYYRDYTGSVADIVTTINQGWFYTGQPSVFHEGQPRGTDPSGLPPRAFYVGIQNHDQVGNRASGDRLHHKVSLAEYRAVSALLLCLPQTPLLFSGQEWAASSPFQYFTDHDAELGKIVTEGRRREFKQFRAFEDPAARKLIPDPQDPTTFERSKLNWSEIEKEPHASIRRLYRELLILRRDEPALRSGEPCGSWAFAVDEESLLLRREADRGATLWLALRFKGPGTIDLAPHAGRQNDGWERVLTTEDLPFAPEPHPAAPSVNFSGPAPVIAFQGPAAVILRQRPVATTVSKG